MNIKTLSFTVGLSLVWNSFLFAQPNNNQALNDLVSKVGNVQADKINYQQTFKVIDSNKGKIEVVVSKVEGTKSTNYSYEVYLSDIDKNTVVSKPSGKIINIELSIQNNLKFVKEYADGKLKEYSSKMEIIATDADNARAIVEGLKSVIAQLKPTDMQFNSLKDASDWLSKNISEVNTGTDQYAQAITYDAAKPYLLTYTQTKTDSKAVTFTYDFNIDDINKNAISIAVSGNTIKVKLGTKGNQRLIKVLKNNEIQSYDIDIEILFDDLDKARNTINALNVAISKTKPTVPTFKSSNEALDKMNGWLATSSIGLNKYTQTIAFEPTNPDKYIFSINTTDAKAKVDENKYELYIFDIDANIVNVGTSGKDAQITISTKNKLKYIKTFKNNNQQSYDNEMTLHAPDIESARMAAEAVRFIVGKLVYEPDAYKSITEALSWLKDGVYSGISGTSQIDQKVEYVATEPYYTTFTSKLTDSKGVAKEESYSFYPYTLDAKLCKVSVSGKNVTLEIKSKEKTKFIKASKNGEVQNYTGNFEIEFADAFDAREALASLTYIIDKSTTKTKAWTDKTSAANFVINALKDLSVGKRQVKQKLETTGGDQCKLTYNITNVDEKGISTEEIFEFNLLDINKTKSVIGVDGKSITLKLEIKNQDKLVKYYKASKLQNYASSVEFVFDDYDMARLVQDALVYLVTECQK